MKRSFLLGLLLGVGVLLGTTWDGTFEGLPQGTDLASSLDTFIQDFKLEVRRRASVETIHGTGSDDNGLNRVGSARAFVQNAAPTSIAGPGQYNSSAGIFAGATLTTDEVGASTDDIGKGRFWVDLDGPATGTVATEPSAADTPQLSVWDETLNGFRRVVARDQGGAGVGGSNLIFNGSFEITDGVDGSIASTAIASGWTTVLTPIFAYDSINNTTEGDGVAFETIAAGAALEGVSQTLAGLKESTVYVYRARVRPVVGTCRLLVDDGTTNASDTSAAASGVFETLEVQHTTTAGPADVVVSLLSVADTNECDWDHVTAFERYASHPHPGIQVIQDTSAGAATTTVPGGGTWQNITGLNDLSVTIPGPGYMVRVTGEAVLSDGATGAATNCDMRIQETVGATTKRQTSYLGNLTMSAPATLSWTEMPPLTPGTTLTYSLDIQDGDGGGGARCGVVTTDGEAYLRVELIPVR